MFWSEKQRTTPLLPPPKISVAAVSSAESPLLLAMADRVHPAGDSSDIPNPTQPEAKPMLPPPSYVIQVPKDQIYRVPPPENAHKYKRYVSRAQRRRSCCCCCLAWITGTILLLAFALAVAAGILYFVFRPKLPTFSVQGLSVQGFNISSPDRTFSPEFEVAVRADNPNKKIGIDYRGGSSINIYYSGVDLVSGVWPAFYQGKRNTTVVRTLLTGSVIRLSDAMRGELTAEQRQGAVPLDIDVKVPVRVKLGAVTTWTITVKAKCGVTVDRLAVDSKVVSKSCRVKVKVF